MFENLPHVPTLPAVAANDFGRILAAEQPVIFKNLIAHWPAVAAGTNPATLNAYLKAIDRGALVPVMEAPASSGGRYIYGDDLREFNFAKRNRGLAETLDQIERNLALDNPPFVAVQMLPLTILPDFIADNPLPLMPPQITPRLWIGGKLKTQTHNDRDHNLACVVAGRRRFLLFPPDQVANLYVGPLDNPPPLSLVDPEAPDYDRFPKFREAMASAVIAHLEPGDALFMPKYWWHHVTSLEPYNVMVNYWWGDYATGLERASDAFLTALLALGALPPGERAYWKAMFDAYVFKAGDDATAHLPPDLKGVLGSMTPALRERLKKELKLAYLKN
ncbi:hypothetical protein ABAC460_19010 [Asticcacaulis sp. AC460]|uniref:cupin-like domain-containing protein n=1 Tax=Asticcacaulis sp. AC460 TaxID=1282360 RepID=UPI0003C3DA4F|nr:cupin-like domain-containing protein [Asticcacaulis sp. AC460]ESQ87418.1 hypothetical protein ABAC460_19010 [Asticcacaulis sp. AC460]